MVLHEESILINMIEAKLLESYPEYCPQKQYNNMFISYLFKYLRDNTYVGKHDDLYNELLELAKQYSDMIVKESTDKQTFTLTKDSGFDEDILLELNLILKKYNNYTYIVKSVNRIVFKVNFGWLPQNAGSWLNLLNSETLIDYYIDGITLVPNTHKQYGGKPDSGYVCYKINSVQEYDTILFLMHNDLNFSKNIKITFASLLKELKGTKGVTLNRIVNAYINPENTKNISLKTGAYYEIGPYTNDYLSTENSSLIIQVPYEYAISDYYYVFNVTNSVQIKTTNDDRTDSINWFLTLDKDYYINLGYNYDDLFAKNTININALDSIINSSKEILNVTLIQYIFGDFIWRTSDSKLIAYIQNLINALYSPVAHLKANGIWSEELSNYIKMFKANAYNNKNINLAFNDDVIDKSTEELMVSEYKLTYNRDPNLLFNEW